MTQPKDVCHVTYLQKSLELSNRLLDIVVKLGVFASIASAVLLWWYLSKIEWREQLFLESISSASGLISIFTPTATLLILVTAIMLCPSVFLIALRDIFSLKRPEKIGFIPFSSYAAWLAALFIGTNIQYKYTVEASVLISVLVYSVLVYSLRKDFFSSFKEPPKNRGQQASALLLVGFVNVLAQVLSTLPMSLAIGIVSKDFEEAWVLLAISVTSMTPGLLIYWTEGSIRSICKVVLFGLLLLALVSCKILPSLGPRIVWKSLGLAGVYGTVVETFVPQSADIAKVVFHGGLLENKSDELFRAYRRYSFGEVRLLCKDPYDPLSDSAPQKDHCVSLKIDDIRMIVVP